MNFFGYSIDNGLVLWVGVPVMLIIIMSMYSGFRKRRSKEY